MANLMRISTKQGIALTRCLSTTSCLRSTSSTPTRAPAPSSELTTEQKQDYFPKLGNRDIVGYGINGLPYYVDIEEFPAPAVRYKENSEEVMALREKEKGDWRKLTMEEKKALYRASFRQTYSEMRAPSGEWKSVLAGVLLGFSVTGWLLIYMKVMVYPPLPHTITEEWKIAQAKRMILERQGAVEGVGSKFDYDKNEWK